MTINEKSEGQEKNTFAVVYFLMLGWILVAVFSFVFKGSISYITLGILLIILAALYLIEKKRHRENYSRPSFLLLVLTVLTGVMNAPLLFPGFVTIEKSGFYALYDDGSSGYAEDNSNHCLNCSNPEFSSLVKGQKSFITGYSFDSNFGGTNREINTFRGPFDISNVDDYQEISLTTPLFLVKTFFAIQTAINIVFFPLAIF